MKLDNAVSYGIAPGPERSVLGARKFACKARDERPWVYKADIQQFFDNIDRALLRAAVEERVKQKSLIPTLHAFLDTEISDGLDRDWKQKVADAGIRIGRGVRQGMPLSPFFAGAYLYRLDQALIRSGVPVARYVDDIVAFFDSEEQCHAFHRTLVSSLADLELDIGEIGAEGSKTRVYAPDEPAAFLGMDIVRQPGGRHVMRVPDKVGDVIRQRFEEASSPAALLERRVQLTTMGRYFDSVVCGYSNAYREAQNFDELRSLLEGLARDTQEAVLIALFDTRLHHLTPDELSFVGVDPNVLSAERSTRTKKAGHRKRAA